MLFFHEQCGPYPMSLIIPQYYLHDQTGIYKGQEKCTPGFSKETLTNKTNWMMTCAWSVR